MPRNVYFSHGTKSEQNLYEDITIEGLKIYGHEAYYIPRKIVNEDSIFNEDQLSEFGSAYAIEAYVANVDGYEGEGDLLSKFGLEIKDQVTLVIANRRWEQLIGRHIEDDTNLDRTVTRRPMEGDLIYLPFAKGLFEITFVEAEDPFYQLQNLPTFQLKCELFKYSGEEIDTGIDDIDTYETQFDSVEQILSFPSGYMGVGQPSVSGNNPGPNTWNDEEQIRQDNATGLEGIPAIGSSAYANFDGVTIEAEVKEILEMTPQKLHHRGETTGYFVYSYQPSTGGFELSTMGGLFIYRKNGHTGEALAAGAVEGTWANYRYMGAQQDTFYMDDTDMGTNEFPKGDFVIHMRPSKISFYGIERSDNGDTGFLPIPTSGGIPYVYFKDPNLAANGLHSDNIQPRLVLDSVESSSTSFAETEKTDPDSDNSEFETIGNNFIDFSISNPFGLPNA